MAEFTLEQIRAMVRFRGDYTNVRKFPNDDVDKEIQKSFGEFYELVEDANEGYWDTDASASTTANTAYVALPTRCWRVKLVEILDSGEYRKLDKTSTNKRSHYGTTTDKPRAYRLTARGIDLMPTPNAVYTLRVTYAPLAPLLAVSQPREWFNGWEDYVLESTLIKLDSGQRISTADRKDTLKTIVERIKAGASKRDETEPEYLNLHEYDTVDPDERWR